MLRIAELLLHSDDVPPAARAALSSALRGPEAARGDNLLSAARILHAEVGIDCKDAIELVGLEAPAAACD